MHFAKCEELDIFTAPIIETKIHKQGGRNVRRIKCIRKTMILFKGQNETREMHFVA
jgi:hypothetical protein